jgi:acyl carrier protein
MTVDLTRLEQTLIDWVLAWTEGALAAEFSANTDLLTSGVLDSIGFTGLIMCLEAETGIEFDYQLAEARDGTSIRELLEYCFPDETASLPGGLAC